MQAKEKKREMAVHQRIVRVRREYNQWVANQTLEDYALRFTAEGARRWSAPRIANTALGSISFLALEAIGAAITLSVGFTNAISAILIVGTLIFLTALPISYYAAKYGLDIDLLTRGAGFGYIGSTVTSLIYASFTFIFFAIEAAIMAQALDLCFGLPLAAGYIVSALAVIPLVTYGITFISRFQLWTQPVWVVLHLLPFIFIAASAATPLSDWVNFMPQSVAIPGFDIALFGAAASVVFSLIAQVGEQVDFLRFLPDKRRAGRFAWWTSLLCSGPGWIVLGILKLLAGSFLAVLVLNHGLPFDRAAEPAYMYWAAFGYVVPSQSAALVLTGFFLILSQLKINVTNAYAGSLAWSNFFSRLTHSHPGRVVWLVFNVSIALLLMELGIYRSLEQTLGLYSNVAVSWVGALVADLVINKPLGLSPKHIEFKRAHLYDFNPVGVGAMIIASTLSIIAFSGACGVMARALAPFIALASAFISAPLIAYATGGRFYLAREALRQPQLSRRCCICEHTFERPDMAFCPAYAGPICSLCCSLDARCHDSCKTNARFSDQLQAILRKFMPAPMAGLINSRVGHFLGVLLLLAVIVGVTLTLVFYQSDLGLQRELMHVALWKAFFILMITAGIAAWLFVLAEESRKVAEEESHRQTALLMQEIEAHKRTDAALQKAKDAAEAANLAKSRYVVGISHELRTPLNSIFGYAQLLERDPTIPEPRQNAIRTMRRSAQHLSGLIEGLLDISKIEAGRLVINRERVRLWEFLDQLTGMFRMQAAARGIAFQYELAPSVPAIVNSDEKRLRQILINLLSNAIKFTEKGFVRFSVSYRNQVAEFIVEDSGFGILPEDMDRIFNPFERGRLPSAVATPGTGLGLTITKLLAEIMGGEILLSSEAGLGTKVRVRLMLSRAVEEIDVPVERAIMGYKGRPRTVIVVDDDPVHRDLMQDVLAPLGFVIFTAEDGFSCISLAEQCDPDLILLDITMPGITGWQVAERLADKGCTAPILMLSASVAEFTKTNGSQSFHTAVLSKPLHIPQLMDALQTALKLEWDYGSETERSPNEPPALISPSGLDRAELGELIKLGKSGHIRAIETRLDDLERTAPETRQLTARLRGHIREIDLDQYMSDLEALSRYDS
jgi:signal transduction histidine kinase/CheY-like chemotaxis protein/purine-cytosine permease-like protein